MAPNPNSLYRVALREARARGHELSRDAVARIRTAFRAAIADLKRTEQSSNPLTRSTAAALRTEIENTLRELEQRSNEAVTRDVALTIKDIVRLHARAVEGITKDVLTGTRAAAITASFSTLPIRVVASYNSRRVSAAAFETLMRRNLLDAAPALDQMISSALAQGMSSARLTKDIAQLLSGNTTTVLKYGADAVKLADYGLRVREVSGLSSLFYDARRIAVSEINNAYREANNLSLKQSGIVAAAQWQLSGNHPEEDDCDDLAQADDYGFGPGFYPPGEEWPDAPHPFCACTQGEVIFLDPSEW